MHDLLHHDATELPELFQASSFERAFRLPLFVNRLRMMESFTCAIPPPAPSEPLGKNASANLFFGRISYGPFVPRS